MNKCETCTHASEGYCWHFGSEAGGERDCEEYEKAERGVTTAREVKFRAWDTKYNCMDAGPFWVESDGTVWEGPQCTFDTPNQEIELTGDLILMQYTGLNDKNGAEIYEGDIIYSSDMLDGDVVIYANGGFNLSGGDSGLNLLYQLEESGHYLVIGNIHDDPELVPEWGLY